MIIPNNVNSNLGAFVALVSIISVAADSANTPIDFSFALGPNVRLKEDINGNPPHGPALIDLQVLQGHFITLNPYAKTSSGAEIQHTVSSISMGCINS
jgi:hypothetical protein